VPLSSIAEPVIELKHLPMGWLTSTGSQAAKTAILFQQTTTGFVLTSQRLKGVLISRGSMLNATDPN
jgi:hypothetical protein